MTTMKTEDFSYAVGRCVSSVRRRTNPNHDWTEGTVRTPHGIVEVYAQGSERSFRVTRLDFVWEGRVHVRSFRGKRYSPRGIVTKAKEFARHVVEQASE